MAFLRVFWVCCRRSRSAGTAGTAGKTRPLRGHVREEPGVRVAGRRRRGRGGPGEEEEEQEQEEQEEAQT